MAPYACGCFEVVYEATASGYKALVAALQSGVERVAAVPPEYVLDGVTIWSEYTDGRLMRVRARYRESKS